jgi:YHYH protein/Secretion system C-terminal sorting domain
MLRKLLLFAAFTLSLQAQAQTSPDITSWILNTTGDTGYGGIESNVQQVQYSDSNVYISATCIPGYDIGPWSGDPNIPANQNFVYQIPRYPRPYTDTPTNVGLGHIGVWINGVSIFNALDAHSYDNLNVWHQNAYVFEGSSFDSCLGHPAPGGEYHHHVSPRCLYDVTDSAHHSPIIGWAFDGYPIYGAYGYKNTDGTGGIKRMKSSYQLRNMVSRDTLPDGTVLTSTYYGPAVSTTYPLGSYQEDYQFVPGAGDLDTRNGRVCVTPEFPLGTYAYFVTVDSALNPVYPYTLGNSYYGIVASGDVGPASGHVTITDSVTTYKPTQIAQVSKSLSVQVYPNPAHNYLYLFIQPVASNNFVVTLTDEGGKKVFTQKNVQPTIQYSLNVSALPAGIYTLSIRNGEITYTDKVTIEQ